MRDTEVRRALRAEAAAHQPDRSAMLDRVTRTALRGDQPLRRPRTRWWAAGAAAAATAVLGGGGLAQWALAGEEAGPGPTPIVTSAAPAPTRSVVPPIAGKPSRRPSATPAFRKPALWSDGSVDAGDSQGASVVTIKTTERVDALRVTIRVARTPELVSRGGSRQVPGASVTTTVTEEPDALIYRFTLSGADSLPPGKYTFSARYTHAEGGRNAGDDAYAVDGSTASSSLRATGDFG